MWSCENDFTFMNPYSPLITRKHHIRYICSPVALDLGENLPIDFEPDCFICRSCLEVLLLDSNQVKIWDIICHFFPWEFSLMIFGNMSSKIIPSNQWLTLHFLQLLWVAESSPARSAKLTSLDILRNHLFYLENKTFHLIPTLQMLNLPNCSLSSISFTSLLILTHLRTRTMNKNW